MRSRLVLILSSILALFVSASPAWADRDVFAGVRGGYYFDVDEPFIGGEFLVRIAHSWYFNPNFEWVFRDDSYWSFNLDAHYDFPTHNRTFGWAGAGLGLVRIDPPGNPEADTDPALNLLFGAGLSRHPVIPYIQVKAIVKDNSEVALALGLRF